MSKSPRPSELPTGAQMEILEAVAAAGDRGLSAPEVWTKLSEGRDVARTTVITLLQRLEQRGWLSRQGDGRGAIYRSLHAPEQATARIADGFLGRYFEGSASKFVSNLLGEGQISQDELERLRSIIAKAVEDRK